MTFVERDQKVEAFSAERPSESLAEGIRLRRPDWRSQHLHAHGGYLLVQFLREDAVAVVDEEPIRITTGERLPELLRGPFRRRVGSHTCDGGFCACPVP